MTSKITNHWPRKADFKSIRRDRAIALVSDFGDLYGLDVLRVNSNFTHAVFGKASHFDDFDLTQTLQFAIGHMTAPAVDAIDPERKRDLLAALEQACGPLDKPIAFSVGGVSVTFVPLMA
ncbi:hypothetical protein [Janthinobacterium sp. LB3P118]|uniref:hypothetical protein n=1 Tax=Janthinobacterium sp. LB3P118 TaxID=3424195 RepID=UPI003F213283